MLSLPALAHLATTCATVPLTLDSSSTPPSLATPPSRRDPKIARRAGAPGLLLQMSHLGKTRPPGDPTIISWRGQSSDVPEALVLALVPTSLATIMELDQ